MTAPHDGRELLDLPARYACRIVAAELLDRVDEGYRRLSDPDDADAVHDFRVALRRLRSWVRAFRPWMEETLPPRHRKRLRKLARSTSEIRDLEIQIDWLREQSDSLSPAQQIGARWLLDRLEDHRSTLEKEKGDELAEIYPELRDQLAAAFREYSVRVTLADGPGEPLFAQSFGELIREHADDLREKLEHADETHDTDAYHRARIAGKRLRYLLEPVVGEVDAARPLVKRLKALQDAAGALCDANVIAGSLASALEAAAVESARSVARDLLADEERAEPRAGRRNRSGLMALTRRARDLRHGTLADLERDWSPEAAGARFRDLEDLVASVRHRAGAALEIERKYLLSALPPLVREKESIAIEQGYLPGEGIVERLRSTRATDGTVRTRTIKTGTGLVRMELEEEVTPELFDAMWPLTKGSRLSKIRYLVPDDGLTWEVDEFTDRDLCLAEVRLPAPDSHFEIPDWLAPYIVRDVTGEPPFTGVVLARDRDAEA